MIPTPTQIFLLRALSIRNLLTYSGANNHFWIDLQLTDGTARLRSYFFGDGTGWKSGSLVGGIMFFSRI